MGKGKADGVGFLRKVVNMPRLRRTWRWWWMSWRLSLWVTVVVIINLCSLDDLWSFR